MKITNIETLHGDGGYRVCSFVKVSTDKGVVGWAEYYEGLTGVSVTPLIRDFAKVAAGMDPRQVGRLSESLLATTRLSWGGLAHQAVAAIENACLDIHAKSLGVPVHALFGGPFRERVPVYWTHCGSYRVRHPAFYEKLGYEPVRTLDDFTRLGREAVQQGFRAVKTNPVFFENGKPYMFNGGFRIAPGFLDRSITDHQIGGIVEQLEALREGIGPDRGLMLDVSFSQRTEGYLRLARRLEPLHLYWLELDMRDPEGLALIRQSTGTPIASLESLHGIHDFRPYLAGRTVDTAIVDPMWNGVWQSVRVATLADAFETHIAPHNPVGDLANLMSAHFCASIPNFRIMELRADKIVTQIVRETTLAPNDFLKSNGQPKRRVEDPATIAWKLTTGAYYKDSGKPWQLANVRPGVCYVGLAYKRRDPESDDRFSVCAAQMFLSSGEVLFSAEHWALGTELTQGSSTSMKRRLAT